MNAPRAMILAAGTGSRLGATTATIPKCLVPLAGKPLLDWQLTALRGSGIETIACITGAHAEQLQGRGLATFHNDRYASTNMVTSLMCGRDWFDGSTDILVVYGDIVYQPNVVSAALSGNDPISVVVDRNWRALWEIRMDNPLADAETLKINPAGTLIELGKKPASYADIEAQYIGMIKIQASFTEEFVATYDKLDPSSFYDGRDRDNMYMTSLIQHFIDNEIPVGASAIHGGWVEVDTMDDINAYESRLSNGMLDSILDFGTL